MLGEGWKGRNIMFKTMLVEDSTSFRQIVKDNLKDQYPSMDIIEAADGVEALRENRFSSSKSDLYGHPVTRGKRP